MASGVFLGLGLRMNLYFCLISIIHGQKAFPSSHS